jgi:predicted lipoprotein
MLTGALSMGFVSCSSDDDNAPDFNNKVYGQQAMNACEDVINQLNLAMNQIEKSNLTDAQKAELQQILENNVDNVIVPTYKNLADAAEKLQK